MPDDNRKIMEKMDYSTFISIIENIPSCIFFKDTELRYQFCSHRWAQVVSGDIVGKTDMDIRKDKENALKAMEADQEILQSKKGCSYVIKSDIDGEISYLELIKEPLLDSSGEAIGIVGLINDVTEKTIMEKKIVGMSEMLEVKCQELEASNTELKTMLEKVKQMHRSQKLFTASMNHELRSPLNGIIGTLQMLLDDMSLNEEQRDCVHHAFQSSQLMLEIVNELLDFAKMEMDGFVIKQNPFILFDLTDYIKYVAKTQAQAKNLEFLLTIAEGTPECYCGDEVRIKQIMHNIISNAIKYTDKGSVHVTVSYEDKNLIIVCADTGQGISKESMEQLFTPFVRLNEKKNSNIQGTGLGLAVVKKMIELMGGEITVSSKINEGSVFTVRLPMKSICIEKPHTTEEEFQETMAIDFTGLSALCVDDSVVNVKVMSSLLKKMGMKVEVAYSAKESIIKSNEKHYDIIFMDHFMTEMDGVEAFRIIRGTSTYNQSTPVVMLTGNADLSYGEYYREVGIDGYLIKPVLKDSVIRELSKIFSD